MGQMDISLHLLKLAEYITDSSHSRVRIRFLASTWAFIQIRTTAVCRELETTDDPIGEIAERHGFRDPKMLNHYFREIYGCTPSEKRKFFREVTLEDSDNDPDEI